jgi:hypothetical protein
MEPGSNRRFGQDDATTQPFVGFPQRPDWIVSLRAIKKYCCQAMALYTSTIFVNITVTRRLILSTVLNQLHKSWRNCRPQQKRRPKAALCRP